jgi:hypothetical protein
MGPIVFVMLVSTLGFFLIGVLPKPELTFPRSERLDQSTRKRLGTFVVAIAYIVVMVGMLLVLHIDSIRNWIGAVCLFIGLLRLASAVTNLKLKPLILSERSEEPVAKQIQNSETYLSFYNRTRTSILFGLSLQSLLVVFLFYSFRRFHILFHI